jgi:hypothetical protein
LAFLNVLVHSCLIPAIQEGSKQYGNESSNDIFQWFTPKPR